jgi:hypothetical protein
VLRIPATWIASLTVTGTPGSGPVSSPRAIASSAATASRSAASRRSSTTAFRLGLTASILAPAGSAHGTDLAAAEHFRCGGRGAEQYLLHLFSHPHHAFGVGSEQLARLGVMSIRLVKPTAWRPGCYCTPSLLLISGHARCSPRSQYTQLCVPGP